jgi:cytochrome c551/c552
MFNANCAACHKLDAKATGPALRGIAAKYEMAWFTSGLRTVLN